MIRFLLCISLSACLFGLFSCAGKSVDLKTYEDTVLRFGRGGGFSGLKSEYVLLKDGRIFRRDPVTDSLTYINRAVKKKTNAAFADFERLAENEINAPGDMYYYVTKAHNEEETNLVWSDLGSKVDPELLTYWNQLNSLVKNR